MRLVQPCRAGRADFCVTGEYEERGIARRHGYMAERIADEARWFVPVPRELRDVALEEVARLTGVSTATLSR